MKKKKEEDTTKKRKMSKETTTDKSTTKKETEAMPYPPLRRGNVLSAGRRRGQRTQTKRATHPITVQAVQTTRGKL